MGDVGQAKALISAGVIAKPSQAPKASKTAAPSSLTKEPTRVTKQELDKVLSREFATDREFFNVMADITDFTLEELYYKPLAELKRIWQREKENYKLLNAGKEKP